MNTQHTPGPWEAIGNLVRGPMCAELGSGVMIVECADRFFQKTNSEEAKANARLIAAAPDLLHAIEMVRDADNDCMRDGLQTIPPIARKTIDDAIAKATGESQ